MTQIDLWDIKSTAYLNNQSNYNSCHYLKKKMSWDVNLVLTEKSQHHAINCNYFNYYMSSK